jgi:TorA maturation chaperone TorD
MSVGGAVSARAAGVAPAARLLAGWWSRPTPDELKRWALSWPDAYDAAQVLELRADGVAELEAALEASQVKALREEYERLLVGPGHAPCPPYESLWRADQPRREQGRLMGAAAAEVVRIYQDLGLQVRTDAHELPDHVAVEWEALAYAFEHDAAEASVDLARAHLAVWMSPFCAAVAAETEQSFYTALARLTPEWTAALAG